MPFDTASSLRHVRGLLFTTFLALLLTLPSVAQQVSYDTLGTWQSIDAPNSTYQAIAAKGTTTFVSGDEVLQALDLSDMNAPVLLGELPFDLSSYHRFALSGDLLFIVTFDHFTVVDVADPSAMRIVGQTERTLAGAKAMAVEGSNVLVTSRGYDRADGYPYPLMVEVYDVSDPAAPSLASSMQASSYDGDAKVTARGDLAVTAGEDSLAFIDISDPATASVVSRYPFPNPGAYPRTGLAIKDNHLFIKKPDSVNVYDITDPSSLARVGGIGAYGGEGIFIQGDSLIIAPRSSNGRVIDISDPSAMVEVATFDPGEVDRLSINLKRVAVTGSAMYGTTAPNSNGEPRIVRLDLTDLTAPVLDGVLSLGNYVYESAVDGDYAYVMQRASVCCTESAVKDFHIVDISDPAAPRTVSSLNVTDGYEGFYEVAVAGDLAMVENRGSTVYLIDVSDPAAPEVAGAIRNANGVIQGEAYAYVWDGDGFRAMDLSDPANPVTVGEYTASGEFSFPSDVEVEGSYAYIAGEMYGGLVVVDLSDPAAMTVVGSIALESYDDLVFGNGYVFVNSDRDDADNLRIVDVSDPANPTLVNTVATNGLRFANELTYQDGFLYAPLSREVDDEWIDILAAYDVTDPTQVTEVESFGGKYGIDEYGDVVAADGRLYLAGGYDGLLILEADADGVATSEEQVAGFAPSLQLRGNAPNPVRSETTIRYALPKASDVRLEVFDMLGRRVATLVDGKQPAGDYAAHFDASSLSSGVYVYMLQAGEARATGKMLLVR